MNNVFDRFKLNLRDFLIQLKEFSGDNADLYADEKEQQERDAKAAERERLSKVGGLLKPAELEDDELWLEEELRTEYAEIGSHYQNPNHTRTHTSRHSMTNKLDGWEMYDL